MNDKPMKDFEHIDLEGEKKGTDTVHPCYTAIVLAAGVGSRMRSDIKKQFMPLCGIPVVIHSLRAFDDNENISSIVLVTGKEDMEYALELCRAYGIKKLSSIAEGGSTRFRSVYNGLRSVPESTDYVLIHDGARPILGQGLINRCCDYVTGYKACVAAVPATDTIKTGDSSGYAVETLDRASLYIIQTPQAFFYPLIMDAYDRLFVTINEYGSDESKITDDAVIVESMSSYRIKFVNGDRSNIKITAPEDMIIAEALINMKKNH